MEFGQITESLKLKHRHQKKKRILLQFNLKSFLIIHYTYFIFFFILKFIQKLFDFVYNFFNSICSQNFLKNFTCGLLSKLLKNFKFILDKKQSYNKKKVYTT